MRMSLSVALVFVAACADPLAPSGAGASDTIPSPPAHASWSTAFDSLLATPVFELPGRGLSLTDPPYWVAWREVLRSPTAASDFRYLYDNAITPEGRMYGAAGLLAADSGALTALAADPRWDGVEITVASGCIVTIDPAWMFLTTLATARMQEYLRTGEYPEVAH